MARCACPASLGPFFPALTMTTCPVLPSLFTRRLLSGAILGALAGMALPALAQTSAAPVVAAKPAAPVKKDDKPAPPADAADRRHRHRHRQPADEPDRPPVLRHQAGRGVLQRLGRRRPQQGAVGERRPGRHRDPARLDQCADPDRRQTVGHAAGRQPRRHPYRPAGRRHRIGRGDQQSRRAVRQRSRRRRDHQPGHAAQPQARRLRLRSSPTTASPAATTPPSRAATTAATSACRAAYVRHDGRNTTGDADRERFDPDRGRFAQQPGSLSTGPDRRRRFQRRRQLQHRRQGHRHRQPGLSRRSNDGQATDRYIDFGQDDMADSDYLRTTRRSGASDNYSWGARYDHKGDNSGELFKLDLRVSSASNASDNAYERLHPAPSGMLDNRAASQPDRQPHRRLHRRPRTAGRAACSRPASRPPHKNSFDTRYTNIDPATLAETPNVFRSNRFDLDEDDPGPVRLLPDAP